MKKRLKKKLKKKKKLRPPPTRRSARSTAGVTSRYDGYSMMTRGYGLACANLKVKVALERFGKAAYDAIKDELTQLFIKREP